jgi:hypothetical protein
VPDHCFYELPFTSVTSERWDSLPDMKVIEQQIASAALAHCEVAGYHLGLYSPPKEIKEVRITVAAMDQIQCMWWGHRDHIRASPPTVPLKVFVTGAGQDGRGHSWASIEVHPGMDDWGVPD